MWSPRDCKGADPDKVDGQREWCCAHRDKSTKELENPTFVAQHITNNQGPQQEEGKQSIEKPMSRPIYPWYTLQRRALHGICLLSDPNDKAQKGKEQTRSQRKKSAEKRKLRSMSVFGKQETKFFNVRHAGGKIMLALCTALLDSGQSHYRATPISLSSASGQS